MSESVVVVWPLRTKNSCNNYLMSSPGSEGEHVDRINSWCDLIRRWPPGLPDCRCSEFNAFQQLNFRNWKSLFSACWASIQTLKLLFFCSFFDAVWNDESLIQNVRPIEVACHQAYQFISLIPKKSLPKVALQNSEVKLIWRNSPILLHFMNVMRFPVSVLECLSFSASWMHISVFFLFSFTFPSFSAQFEMTKFPLVQRSSSWTYTTELINSYYRCWHVFVKAMHCETRVSTLRDFHGTITISQIITVSSHHIIPCYIIFCWNDPWRN